MPATKHPQKNALKSHCCQKKKHTIFYCPKTKELSAIRFFCFVLSFQEKKGVFVFVGHVCGLNAYNQNLFSRGRNGGKK